MHVTTARTWDGERIAVAGALDADAAPRLHAQLSAATERSDPVVLDLSGVTMLGADALRVLVQVHASCARNGRRLEIAAVSPAVLVAFARAGVRRELLAPLPAYDPLRAYDVA